MAWLLVSLTGPAEGPFVRASTRPTGLEVPGERRSRDRDPVELQRLRNRCGSQVDTAIAPARRALGHAVVIRLCGSRAAHGSTTARTTRAASPAAGAADLHYQKCDAQQRYDKPVHPDPPLLWTNGPAAGGGILTAQGPIIFPSLGPFRRMATCVARRAIAPVHVSAHAGTTVGIGATAPSSFAKDVRPARFRKQPAPALRSTRLTALAGRSYRTVILDTTDPTPQSRPHAERCGQDGCGILGSCRLFRMCRGERLSCHPASLAFSRSPR